MFRQVPWQVVNEAYQELEASGELTVRVREQANLTTVPELMAFIEADHPATGRFSMGPLKLLGDGALGARTAFLSRSYADVMAGIQCAVTRSDLKGHGPYLPDQAFSVREALDSFTKAGAYASFEEHTKGQIQPGMLADFVLLGADPIDADRVEADRTGPKLDPARLKDIRILETWLEGEQVWRFQNPCSGQ